MATVLLYVGIALTVAGWLALSWFAVKQISARKEYERLPQKWDEIKQTLMHKRNLCRYLIMSGLLVLIISLLL